MPAFPIADDAPREIAPLDPRRTAYTRFVLLVAGLGGLLYGVDVGIIGGALPYLQATRQLSAGQLSTIVAAVLLGSVISTLFAGVLADLIGRKPLMIVSGIAFSISIPIIALSQSYSALFYGRLLQGISGGFIGVVVPLYLAECLPASTRGRGTAIFQWLLTFGIFSAAVIGLYFSYRVTHVTATANAHALFQFKDHAWRSIFWVSLPPGALFVMGALFVGESPRWLFRKGKTSQAETALLRSRMPEQAALELAEMAARDASASSSTTAQPSGSILRRKYIIPFVLACVILACNQATGINSIIGYNTNILLQSGLSDLAAHWGYVVFTAVNFCMTMVGVELIDRKGRKFLFTLGCSGLFASLVLVGFLFRTSESNSVDVTAQVQAMVSPDQTLKLPFDPTSAAHLLGSGASTVDNTRASLAVIYSYGDYTGATSIHRSDDAGSAPITVTRADALPGSRVESFFQNPFANLDTAKTAPLHIVGAKISAVPTSQHGWLLAIGLYLFMSFYAIGPGVCVWLALSELMPTRIRSNGMSIALVINQIVSTALAGVFLPVVSKHGYSFIFFLFAGCSLVYLLTVAFFLPETKGRTLEEIEQLFDKAPAS
ncbi:Sugar transporter [Bryocella elongata]|uniref:Sugar transporter n=1 Tax=Bryocella elongata TaxID=863522 RepID=A0A1H5SK83_9BACT|nr:MFS transporter [Bryocella elongata]SEF50840.1 Sugar transporter [Bryocella elongata]